MSNTLQKLPPFNLHTTQVTSSLKKRNLDCEQTHKSLEYQRTFQMSKHKTKCKTAKHQRSQPFSLGQTYKLTNKRTKKVIGTP